MWNGSYSYAAPIFVVLPWRPACCSQELDRFPTSRFLARLPSKGKPPAAAVIRSMRRRGLDLSSHLSNSVDSALENVPDLVLVMTGQHIRSLVDRDRRLLPRTFTLKEFVRLTEVEGQRTKNEDIASYVERVGRSRTFSEGFSWGSEDISDPYGRRRGLTRGVPLKSKDKFQAWPPSFIRRSSH